MRRQFCKEDQEIGKKLYYHSRAPLVETTEVVAHYDWAEIGAINILPRTDIFCGFILFLVRWENLLKEPIQS
jgi:hypothetical protein